jgi:hypothetical protein
LAWVLLKVRRMWFKTHMHNTLCLIEFVVC